MDYTALYNEVLSNGHFTIPHFFSKQEVTAIKTELIELFEEDIAYRNKNTISTADHQKDGYTYSLTDEMHTLLFPAFCSEKTALLIEKIITHPTIALLLKNTIGECYRLRVDLVRKATGKNDGSNGFKALPHTWHRDTPGEFTFGIFLDDMVAPFSGGTSVISGGTHLQPHHPLWDFMFEPQSYTTEKHYAAQKLTRLPSLFSQLGLLNQLAKKAALQKAVEIRGEAGDIYFFLNDVWHGRAPNLSGKSFMTIRFGGFPTDFPFKEDLPLPAGIEKLPPTLKARYSQNQPINSKKDLLIHKTRTQKANWLYRLACKEKKVAVVLLEKLYNLRQKVSL